MRTLALLGITLSMLVTGCSKKEEAKKVDNVEKAPTAPEKAPAAPEKAPAAPEKAPAAPEKAPAAPEKAPTAPEKAPTAPEKAPTAPEKAPAAPEKAPTAPEKLPTAAEMGPAGPGAASPEALGKSLISGFNAMDVKGVQALFASTELMKASMTCADNKRLGVVARQRVQVAKEMDSAMKGVKFEWAGFEQDKGKTFAKGEQDSGCTYNQPVTMKKVKIKFKMTKDGKTDAGESGEGVTVVKVADGGWYFLTL